MNKWTIVKLRFHPLFVFVLAGSLITGYFQEIATLFIIVIIHELGHLAAASSFGWRVKEVQLLPFGGVVVVDELGTVKLKEEIIVALSGPLQNVIMMGLGFAALYLGLWETAFASYFIEANLIIVLFNMLPISPLDGGKILQALLCYLLPYHRAIVWSTMISLLMGGLLCFIAIIPLFDQGLQLNFFIIGLFLIYSNWIAYKNTPYHFIRFLMHRQQFSEQFLRQGGFASPIIVQKNKTMNHILKLFKREQYHLIYVLNDRGSIHAVIPEQKIIDKFLKLSSPGRAG